jgi:hypothetical protein
VWVVGSFAAFWLAGLLFFPINLPDWWAVELVQRHFFAPLEIALAVQLAAVGWIARRRDTPSLAAPVLTFGILATTAAALFLHFNFKAWMPFVTPVVYDAAYARIDGAAAPVVQLFKSVRAAIAAAAPIDVDPLYHHAFVVMFFASLLLHALFDAPARFRRFAMTVNLILLAGGVSYWLFPAIGPFIYGPGLNAQSAEAQRTMLLGLNTAVASGVLPDGYFVTPPAAMPSLHIAHSVVLALFAWRLSRPLGIVYVPIVAWMFIEAVASGFHYLIDLPAGVLLAWFCYRCAVRLVPLPAAALARRSSKSEGGSAAVLLEDGAEFVDRNRANRAAVASRGRRLEQ